MKLYRDYADYLAERFPCKMQKLTVNAHFSCPNRDGSIGYGGCSYCNNNSFSPAIEGNSITQQLINSRQFFAHKYPNMRYIAYFQSYTNTHAPIDRLLDLYNEALSVDGVDAIIIGTRPDCISAHLLDALAEINRHHRVIIEYGAESSHDSTLQLVNRCHSWQCVVDAVEMTKQRGIDVGLHFIIGLPGENTEMIMQTVDAINHVKPDTVKFHQLQLIRNTRLAQQVENGEIEIPRFSVEQYINLCCDIIHRIDPSIAIERFVSQAPDNLLIYPRWGLKNYQFTNLLNNALLNNS
ncbi:MAG: TIGR01212 family radical SAM protein [Muribaculaceae bacterium]|nr:TIGR01212 family radical SAM protein [Muribaculaceae bacterium]